MSITDTQIDAITNPAELNLRIGIATGDTGMIAGQPWDIGTDYILLWQIQYLWRLMYPTAPLGITRTCRAFVTNDADAEWAAGTKSLTRNSGESNTDLIKRTLKRYNADQAA